VIRALGGGVKVRDVDREFEEFVRKHYKQLTENQKRICNKLGIHVPN